MKIQQTLAQKRVDYDINNDEYGFFLLSDLFSRERGSNFSLVRII